jgi:hypothetical protein
LKALTERLEWVLLYLKGGIVNDDKTKEIVLDELLAAMAIADALPDITINVPGGITLAPGAPVSRRGPPPDRIIDLPDMKG